jgi:hypothetical protein
MPSRSLDQLVVYLGDEVGENLGGGHDRHCGRARAAPGDLNALRGAVEYIPFGERGRYAAAAAGSVPSFWMAARTATMTRWACMENVVRQDDENGPTWTTERRTPRPRLPPSSAARMAATRAHHTRPGPSGLSLAHPNKCGRSLN